VLKIDQTFVHDMIDDPEDLTIVEGMLGLASAFRRQPIAEGVETVEQGLLLLRLGCEIAQGFGIAPPMPPEDLPAWLASWNPDPEWSRVAALDPADRPLLYAGAEHSAWVSAIEAFLHGKRRVSPSLDTTQCRFGAWMSEANRTANAPLQAFRALGELHSDLHACGARILDLKADNRTVEALQHLSHLHELCNRLLAELKSLLRSG